MKNKFQWSSERSGKQLAFPDTLPGIDIPNALRLLDNNPKLLKKLLIGFHGHYKGITADIVLAIDSKNFKAAAKIVHSMKSAAGSLSAKALFRACERLEEQLKQEIGPPSEKLMAEFEQALREVLEAGVILKENQRKLLEID